MGTLGRRVLTVLPAVEIVYSAYVILHAVIARHRDTGVFWGAIVLLCLFLALQVVALRGVTRRRRPRFWNVFGGLLVVIGLLSLV